MRMYTYIYIYVYIHTYRSIHICTYSVRPVVFVSTPPLKAQGAAIFMSVSNIPDSCSAKRPKVAKSIGQLKFESYAEKIRHYKRKGVAQAAAVLDEFNAADHNGKQVIAHVLKLDGRITKEAA